MFTIEDASLREVGDTYAANWLVRLDVAAGADAATPAAYVEINVTRRRGPTGDDPAERSQALYDLVKQMMDTLNVELEYRVRRDLKTWLTTAPLPAAGRTAEFAAAHRPEPVMRWPGLPRLGPARALSLGGPIMARSSRRVEGSSRKAPSMRLVTMQTPVLWTPRVVMHSWAASMITAVPKGCRTSWMVLAIWAVSFSWICRRWA